MADMKSVEWEIDQLVKARLFPDEQSVLRSVKRSLFEAKPELKRKMVVTAYTNGEISISKAAQIMGVSQEEMKDIIRETGGQIHLGPLTIDELKRGIEKGYHPPAGLRSRNPAGGFRLQTSRRVSLCTFRARCYLQHEGGYP